MQKSHRETFEPDENAFNLINGDDEVHARQRRSIAHAFSDKAVSYHNLNANKTNMSS